MLAINKHRLLPKGSAAASRSQYRWHQPRQVTAVQSRRVSTHATATEFESATYILSNGMVDYYEVLGVDDDASTDEIKRAYRALAKECHPDYLGDKGHNICIMLNEAYETLSNADARHKYNIKLENALADQADDYTGEALSKWIPATRPKMAKHKDPEENRGVFVDEISCIGCKQCVFIAAATFRLEADHGRSRVFAQWLDDEDTIQAAIDSCPVSCIHWVERQQLPALEHVMQKKITERVNVGVMMAGQGRVIDVFNATQSFLKERKRKDEAAANAKRAYSPAQEESRRKAAQDLAQQHMGFFANMFSSAFASMGDMVGDDRRSGLSHDERVGQRKRASGWRQREEAQAQASAPGNGSYSVPPEYALVPISVYCEEEP